MICSFLKMKKAEVFTSALSFVQAERLELSHLAALDPKSSVSTNSTTPATYPKFRDANIDNTCKLQTCSL